jgi:hypothetical protein
MPLGDGGAGEVQGQKCPQRPFRSAHLKIKSAPSFEQRCYAGLLRPGRSAEAGA